MISLLNRKESVDAKTGIFGDATDYNIYYMSRKDTTVGFGIGFGLAMLAMVIVYDSLLAGLILGLLGGVAGIPLYKKHLQKKRLRMFTIQFRDLLESLTTSLRTGQNPENAFKDAEADMASQYGEDSDIFREVQTINLGLKNTYSVEYMLTDLADRCGIEDIRTFALIFKTVRETGGDLSKIIQQTHDIISQKMIIEMEIQTTIAENQNQMKIMLLMPFLIILLLRYMGNADIVNNTTVNVIVKTVAMFIFGGAYLWGQKISNIKV